MKRLLLIIALLLSLGCAGANVKSEPVKQEKCFTLENRTNAPMRMALCRENGEFFFAEVFQPLEIKQACGDEVGTGTFIFCWQSLVTLNLDCMSFIVMEKDIPTLYDEKVDIWIEPTNKQTS